MANGRTPLEGAVTIDLDQCTTASAGKTITGGAVPVPVRG
jgi:hypothetical protein